MDSVEKLSEKRMINRDLLEESTYHFETISEVYIQDRSEDRYDVSGSRGTTFQGVRERDKGERSRRDRSTRERSYINIVSRLCLNHDIRALPDHRLVWAPHEPAEEASVCAQIQHQHHPGV
jgi:hypothetical protein